MTDVQVESSTQLLVEGNDQVNFFDALIRHLDIDGIQIHNFGGVSDLALFVETLSAMQEFRERVESVGIVRDAEKGSAQSAFQSVQSSLCKAGLPVAERMNQRFGSSPAVSVFILPDNESGGMLETLLCRTLVDTPFDHCIDDFFGCVATSTGESPHSPDKSRAFAYIATMRRPNVSVGVAAKKRYWNLDHAAFSGVRQFLGSL